MARPALTTDEREAQHQRHRRQLLRGMAASIAEKGYAATTIADVVREARVSKSTFYTHFTDKEACYVALYSAATDNVLAAMEQADEVARAEDLPWREHLRAVNRAYISALARGGGLTWSLLIEVQTAGPEALAMRRDVLDRYARLLRRISDGVRRRNPQLRPLSPSLALAVVGGTNELVMEAVESGPVDRLSAVARAATDLWCATLTAATL